MEDKLIHTKAKKRKFKVAVGYSRYILMNHWFSKADMIYFSKCSFCGWLECYQAMCWQLVNFISQDKHSWKGPIVSFETCDCWRVLTRSWKFREWRYSYNMDEGMSKIGWASDIYSVSGYMFHLETKWYPSVKLLGYSLKTLKKVFLSSSSLPYRSLSTYICFAKLHIIDFTLGLVNFFFRKF